ncbi:MAG: hypothetical protein LBS31_11860, partial [Candidatus Adiutrix sp.]|nr:hypothetical protein [Candidatus Adiutrix sp.]
MAIFWVSFLESLYFFIPTYTTIEFQSTLPQGERPPAFSYAFLTASVSIHAPAR